MAELKPAERRSNSTQDLVVGEESPFMDRSDHTESYRVVVSPPDEDARVVSIVAGQDYSIGCHPDASIVLACEDSHEIVAEILGGPPLAIVSLDRGFPVLVDGEVVFPESPHPLRHQSVITLGEVSILVQRSSKPSGRPHRSGEFTRIIAKTDVPLPTSAAESLREASTATARPPRQRARTRPDAPTPVVGSRGLHRDLVTRNERMLELLDLVKHIADADVPVLILGETGTGKELFAEALHEYSDRRDRQLVTLNCAAIPDNLVESELFGHERGAFSGAAAAKPGLFEAAHGSTLFLDEVGELPPTTQAKLLRVLETKEVLRLGALRPLRVDTRVVAATNRDIQAEISAGAFRADLYYRLNGITLSIPPLRERRDEIPTLAQFFAGRSGATGKMFSIEAMRRLFEHGWPGNVRELRSVVERAVLLARGGTVEAGHLIFDPPPPAHRRKGHRRSSQSDSEIPPPSFRPHEQPTGAVAAKLEEELARRERRRIVRALEQAGGNQKNAAQILGISRRTLITRMEQFDIPRPRKRRA